MRVVAALIVVAGVGSGIAVLASSTSAAGHSQKPSVVSVVSRHGVQPELFASGVFRSGHHLVLESSGLVEKGTPVDPDAIPAVATPEVPSALLIPVFAAALLAFASLNERRRMRLRRLRVSER
jgi:hypothetical protein